MTLVLVSHVAADAAMAARLAKELEADGFDVSGGRPGDPPVSAALEQCDVVVLLVTPDAIASDEMTPTVVRGDERGVPFVPVLLDVRHLDLMTRQPSWRSAIGSASAIEAPREDLDAIVPRLVEGVRTVTSPGVRGAGAPGQRSGRGRVLAVGAAAVALAVAAGVWWATAGGDGDDEAGAGGSTGRSATTSPSATPSATGTPVADSATTPVQSVAGKLRITRVRLVKEFCAGPTAKDCARPQGGNRVVVITVHEWNGGNLPYTEDFAHQMDQAYVQAGDVSAGFTKAKQSFDHSTWEIGYVPVPATAAAGDLLLRWPGNPTLLLHPAGS